MAHVTWDVAIVGGGPAGAACAIALRQTFPALRVGVVESSDYTQLRAGEVLPPLARGLLAHLDVLEQMSGEQGMLACGLASAWGSEDLQERDYFYGTAGEGWYLDRCRFDAMLARKAEALGATVLLRSSLQEAERDGYRWRLRLSSGERVVTRWVVDTTGRKALFARRQGATQCVQDRLTGFLRVVRCPHASSAQMVIEAVPQGWWYTAPLPDGRCIAALMTDADIGRSMGLVADGAWMEALKSTKHVQRVLGADVQCEERMVRSAVTVRLDAVYGEGWIAAGDSAAAYDPLSGCGIVHALRSGIVAAFATGDALCHGDRSGLKRYAAMVRAQVAGFEQARCEQYAREERWKDRPFWQRRQGSALTTMPLDAEKVEVSA
jgi:flavin-dependent dehydrogenase